MTFMHIRNFKVLGVHFYAMHTSLKRLGEIEFLSKYLGVQSIWEIELLQLQQILYVSVAVEIGRAHV